MPDEATLSRIDNIFDDIIKLGGKREVTSIVTNLIVIDAAPAGLSGYIIIRDNRDGDFIPALEVPGIVYTNGDLVNVLFVEGGEPIAFQQGSGSASSNTKVSEVWQSDFSNIALQSDADGNITINDGDLIFGTATQISVTGALEINATEDIVIDLAVGKKLDILGGSNNISGVRIRGNTPATELVDLYVGSTGIFYIDFTNSGEVAPYLEVRPADDEYGLKVNAPGSASAFLNIFVTDAATDVVNLTASNVGGTNGIFLTSSGSVGFGVTPSVPFHVKTTSAVTGFRLEGTSTFIGMEFINDTASPVLFFDFKDASAILTRYTHSGGHSEIQVRETNGSFRIRTNDGSGLSIKSVFTAVGDLGVGSGATTPLAKGHFDQESTTGAKPVLYLDQADLSEEFIEFASTVGAGNPIDTAAIGTYYGKIRVSVAGVGFKYMALYNS